MTVSPVQPVTGVISLVWLITITANVQLDTFVQVSLGQVCVEQAVAEKILELGAGMIVVSVLAVTIVLMIPSISREYLAKPSITALRAHQRKDYVQVERIVLPPLQYPSHVPEVLTAQMDRRWTSLALTQITAHQIVLKSLFVILVTRP